MTLTLPPISDFNDGTLKLPSSPEYVNLMQKKIELSKMDAGYAVKKAKERWIHNNFSGEVPLSQREEWDYDQASNFDLGQTYKEEPVGWQVTVDGEPTEGQYDTMIEASDAMSKISGATELMPIMPTDPDYFEDEENEDIKGIKNDAHRFFILADRLLRRTDAINYVNTLPDGDRKMIYAIATEMADENPEKYKDTSLIGGMTRQAVRSFIESVDSVSESLVRGKNLTERALEPFSGLEDTDRFHLRDGRAYDANTKQELTTERFGARAETLGEIGEMNPARAEDFGGAGYMATGSARVALPMAVGIPAHFATSGAATSPYWFSLIYPGVRRSMTDMGMSEAEVDFHAIPLSYAIAVTEKLPLEYAYGAKGAGRYQVVKNLKSATANGVMAMKVFGAETAQEYFQTIMEYAYRDVLGTLRDDLEHDWDESNEDFRREMWEVTISMPGLILPGQMGINMYKAGQGWRAQSMKKIYKNALSEHSMTGGDQAKVDALYNIGISEGTKKDLEVLYPDSEWEDQKAVDASLLATRQQVFTAWKETAEARFGGRMVKAAEAFYKTARGYRVKQMGAQFAQANPTEAQAMLDRGSSRRAFKEFEHEGFDKKSGDDRESFLQGIEHGLQTDEELGASPVDSVDEFASPDITGSDQDGGVESEVASPQSEITEDETQTVTEAQDALNKLLAGGWTIEQKAEAEKNLADARERLDLSQSDDQYRNLLVAEVVTARGEVLRKSSGGPGSAVTALQRRDKAERELEEHDAEKKAETESEETPQKEAGTRPKTLSYPHAVAKYNAEGGKVDIVDRKSKGIEYRGKDPNNYRIMKYIKKGARKGWSVARIKGGRIIGGVKYGLSKIKAHELALKGAEKVNETQTAIQQEKAEATKRAKYQVPIVRDLVARGATQKEAERIAEDAYAKATTTRDEMNQQNKAWNEAVESMMDQDDKSEDPDYDLSDELQAEEKAALGLDQSENPNAVSGNQDIISEAVKEYKEKKRPTNLTINSEVVDKQVREALSLDHEGALEGDDVGEGIRILFEALAGPNTKGVVENRKVRAEEAAANANKTVEELAAEYGVSTEHFVKTFQMFGENSITGIDVLIRLFEGADPETLLHELAESHYRQQSDEWKAKTDALLRELYETAEFKRTKRKFVNGREAYADTAAAYFLGTREYQKRVDAGGRGITLARIFSAFRREFRKRVLPFIRDIRTALLGGKIKPELKAVLREAYESRTAEVEATTDEGGPSFQAREGYEEGTLEKLGYTDNLNAAGFITPEGKYVDLKKNRMATAISHSKAAGGNLGAALVAGYIRIETIMGQFELGAAPNADQRSSLKTALDAVPRSEEIYLDLMDGKGRYFDRKYSPEVPKQRILNDIDIFFRGEEPHEMLSLDPFGASFAARENPDQQTFEWFEQKAKEKGTRKKKATKKKATKKKTTKKKAPKKKTPVPPNVVPGSTPDVDLDKYPEYVGIKKRIMAHIRYIRGVEQLSPLEEQHMDEWLEKGARLMSNDGDYIHNLLKELDRDPRPPTATEAASLTLHYRKLVSNLKRIQDSIAEETDPAMLAELEIPQREAMAELNKIDLILQSSKAEWSRAGTALQIALAADLSREALVRKMQAAAGGKMTEALFRQVDEMATQIAQLQKDLVDANRGESLRPTIETGQEEVRRSPNKWKAPKGKAKPKVRRDSAIGRLIPGLLNKEQPKDTGGPSYQARGEDAGYNQDQFSAAQEIVGSYIEEGVNSMKKMLNKAKKEYGAENIKQIQGMLEAAWRLEMIEGNAPNVQIDVDDLVAIGGLAKELVKFFIEFEGITEMEPMWAAVHPVLAEMLEEQGRPEWSLKDTKEAIAAWYAEQATLPQDTVSVVSRKIRREVRLALGIDLMRDEGKLPPAGGVKFDTAEEKERQLRKEWTELKKGADADYHGNQVQSAENARKRGLENTINDLVTEIVDREKIVKNKLALREDAEYLALVRLRDRLLKEHATVFEPVVKTEAEKEADAYKRAMAEIERLEEALTEDKDPRRAKTKIESNRLTAARERLAELREDVAERWPTPPKVLTDEQRIKNTSKGLDRSIALLEEDLARKDYAPKETKKVDAPHLTLKRIHLKNLRAQKEALWDNSPQKKARDDAAYLMSLVKRLKLLKEREDRGDFQPKKQKERYLSPEALDIQYQIDLVYDRFKEMRREQEILNYSIPGKVWEVGIKRPLNTMRSIWTSVDWSAVLRQGGLVMAGHPVLAAGALPDMFKATFSNKDHKAAFERLRNRENAPLYRRFKLAITLTEGAIERQEEAYLGSDWIKKVPGIGAVVAGSERAYVTYLNVLRADLFDQMFATLSRDGTVTRAEGEVIANYVNVVTGRGSLSWGAEKHIPKAAILENAAVPMATLFFSPRLVMSRFQTVLGQPLWHGLGAKGFEAGRARKLVAKEYGRMLAGLGTMYASLSLFISMMWDDDDPDKPYIEWSPYSSDFGKLVIGHSRVDLLAGLSQTIVFLQKITPQEATFGLTQKKKLQSGAIADLREPLGAMDPDVWGEMVRFGRGKFAPAISTGLDVVTGRDIFGRKIEAIDYPGRVLLPLVMREAYEASMAQGLPKGAAFTMLAVFGLGVNSYGHEVPPTEADRNKRLEQLRQEIFSQPKYSEKEELMDLRDPGSGTQRYLNRVERQGYEMRDALKEYQRLAGIKYPNWMQKEKPRN